MQEDLGLDKDAYLVYEYWTDTFYGEVADKLTVTLPAFGSAVLSFRKKTGKLQLVSTSRHLTQGAAELLQVHSAPNVLSGVSKVVKDDPYTVRAYDPKTGRLLEKTFLPKETGTLSWEIQI